MPKVAAAAPPTAMAVVTSVNLSSPLREELVHPPVRIDWFVVDDLGAVNRPLVICLTVLSFLPPWVHF